MSHRKKVVAGATVGHVVQRIECMAEILKKAKDEDKFKRHARNQDLCIKQVLDRSMFEEKEKHEISRAILEAAIIPKDIQNQMIMRIRNEDSKKNIALPVSYTHLTLPTNREV